MISVSRPLHLSRLKDIVTCIGGNSGVGEEWQIFLTCV